MKNENFIVEFTESVSQETFKGLIELFNTAHKRKLTTTGKSTLGVDKKKKDSVDLPDSMIPDNLKKKYADVIEEYLENLMTCYNQYVERYPILNKSWPHGVFNYQLQRYYPGGQAYHAWHYESTTPKSSDRILAWMTYLNTVEEGGETEFQYYDMKIKPEMGKTLIWPAGFTHVHRGLPSKSDVKFIITNWFRFAPESMVNKASK